MTTPTSHEFDSSLNTQIDRLPAGTTWLAERDDGAVTIRNCKYMQRNLTTTARVALALTELCCLRGRGIVSPVVDQTI